MSFLKRESLYFGLHDFMFPRVPAAPINLEATDGFTYTITQSADGIYYGEYKNNPYKTALTICHGCNNGFRDAGGNIDYYKFPNFAVGRDFVPDQPQRSICTAECNE